jgi:glycerol-3-phosphate acyltransferase PlsY
MAAALVVTVGYLLGSVPFAFLLARRRGVDLRHAGSGNIGAANVLRTTSVAYAVGAVCLDATKGAVAVLLAQRLNGELAVSVSAGLAAIIGHVYPIWLGFRGGKGVATAAGAFAVLSPVALAIAAAIFLVVVGVTRYISLGSTAASVALAVVAIVGDLPPSVVLGAAAAALIIVHRHRANLARVVAGTERRIGQRA